MKNINEPVQKTLDGLRERAKELNCLYNIEELLNNTDANLNEIFNNIILAIPSGWQYPEVCQARIKYAELTIQSPNFKETQWIQQANIIVHENIVGSLEINYTKKMPDIDEGPFLKEERKLIDTIADRIGHFIMHQQLKASHKEWEKAKDDLSAKSKSEWWIILKLLRSSDPNLLIRITRKMLNHLCWNGIQKAQELFTRYGSVQIDKERGSYNDPNRPIPRENLKNFTQISDDTFKIAEEYFSSDEILSCLQNWIKDDKSSYLVNTIENLHSSLFEIASVVERYHHSTTEGTEPSTFTELGVRVCLISRFLTDQLQYLNIAKNYFELPDFYELLKRIIITPTSHGKLGGKSAGLFLASQIIKKNQENLSILSDIKMPKTWYITSDGVLNFIHYNNLEEIFNQKYKEIEQVRQEYPYVMQVFKNSYFPPDIIKGLSMALDDFGDYPLIVRSSSLLEDRFGAAFSGKYKSLFLANQGSKQERLDSLMDAVAEVYASTFGPDPIEYRTERGLLDFHEEMGIMIQEVVGTKIGHYFFPVVAGVAFSNNEFRWSPRINREDGLIRMVPGLGTRAVDRLSDDYPILLAPGQPGLRANVTIDEIIHYSPKKMDVINLETNSFETIELNEILKKYGSEFPKINQIVSILDHNHIRRPIGFQIDFENDTLIANFEGLLNNTPFVKQIKTILKLLQETIQTPVDIEFAHDGENFYLLQCRPQSFSEDSLPAPIPKDIPKNNVIFSANRYISNGFIPDISHIVYIDPDNYNQLSSISDLSAVGRVVGKLNKLLPKRQFILMGPGRWGSRGDIKLGVNVTYSDINNTAVLIEIARKKGNYTPDLSFGTHFFQDLVESSIRYIPLYPDDPDIIFNKLFLERSSNILPDILPEYAYLADTIHVIDIAKSTDNRILKILMNADLDEAVALITSPSKELHTSKQATNYSEQITDDHWRWRLRMSEIIAKQIREEDFGVNKSYIFGSTKNATAGPNSDIDLLIHFQGTKVQKKALLLWLKGWSLCLSEMNYLRTGYKSEGLLDIHLITDKDIDNKTSYAVKIGAVTDAARLLA